MLASYSQLSHELRLASVLGAWKTIAGLYWFKEQSSIDFRYLNFPVLGVLAFIQAPTISKSKAAFGEATYSLTPGLNLTAGLRRTFDDKSRQGYSQHGNPVFFSSVNDASVSYAQTTGRVGADYALSKSTMLYATLSTGYKAGGFNDGTMQTNRFLRYDPEHLTALEIGIKGRFLDNRLQVNADIFGYNYKDLQLTGVTVDPVTGALATQTLNAGKARASGLEVEGKYALGSAGKITFSATTLDAHFTSYAPLQGVDWAGKRLEKSPRVTFGLGYSHVFNFEDGASLMAYAGTRYSSSYVLNDYGNAKQYTQGRFHKSDINLNYSPSNFRWSLQAYVRNIEDKTVMTSYAAPAGDRPDTVSLAAPRTVGARVSVNF
jgi:iron complex outermembrane receptor protein